MNDRRPDVPARRGLRAGSLLSLAIILTLSSAAYGQFRNTITGFVFTPERAPLTNIPVELLNEVQQVVTRTRTDGSGRFFFSGLTAGRWTIRVLPLGTPYEEQSGEVEIINFIRGGTQTSDSAQRDFMLRLRKDGTGRTAAPGTVYAQEVPENARKLYDRAVDAFGRQRQIEGIDHLRAALKIFPDYYMALELLGREYIKKQDYPFARAAFLKAVSVNEKSSIGWYGLSFAAYALKEPAVAIEAGKRAVALDPNSVESWLILGISHRQAKDFPEAEKSLLRAKKLSNGKNADVHYNLALLYANNMNKFKEAADEMEAYLKVAPPDTKTEEIRKLITTLRAKAQAG